MNELENKTSDCCSDLDGVVRENPTRAILLAVGVGVVIALVVRALQPPPKHRAARLLEDLREQLSDLAEPAYRRASGLASNGASLVQDGVDQFSNLHLDRTFNSVTRKLRNLFR
jgi:ElaB/YqjD/DUF883 family membrane-anchored ribosome-binding protein